MGFDFVNEPKSVGVIEVIKPSATNAIRAHDLASAGQTVEVRFGPFTVCHPVNNLQRVVMQQMATFYDEDKLAVLCDLINQSGPVSLRTMDWLVTSYAKNHEIFASDNREHNLHDNYKLILSKYKRRNFDPFRRSRRKVGNINVCYDVTFKFGKFNFHTTVGQLNFVAWSLREGVYALAVRNKKAIDMAMVQCTKLKRKSGASGERPAKRSHCMVAAFKVNQKIVFD